MRFDEWPVSHGDDNPFHVREPVELGTAASVLPAADLDLDTPHDR